MTPLERGQRIADLAMAIARREAELQGMHEEFRRLVAEQRGPRRQPPIDYAKLSTRVADVVLTEAPRHVDAQWVQARLEHPNIDSIRTCLSRLVRDGRLRRVAHGLYAAA